MCHNSSLENEQIEKCIENGMPRKIIKTLKCTLRKRAQTQQTNEEEQQQNEGIGDININNNKNHNDTLTINPSDSQIFVSKCPFGHGKFAAPAAQFLFSPLVPQTTTSTATTTTTPTTTTSSTNNEYDFTNDNTGDNLLFEQLSRILTTTETTATTADNNGNIITNISDGQIAGDSKKVLLASEKNLVHNDDILAKGTQISREFAYKMQQAIRRLQKNSKIYTLLTRTTQPAHLVVMAIVTFVLLSVWPELSDNKSNHTTDELLLGRQQQKTRSDMFALMAYLGSFSIHFGAQIWMTFVSGLSLYFSLPRHMFGQCQQILFPKYFAMNATLSITMLIIYVKFFINTWTLAKCVQFGSLALTGSIELMVRLYLVPPLLRLMLEKYKIEGSIGSGQEIGSLVQGDLIRCPHYQRIHKAFRRLHMTVAIGNVIAMAGSCLQLYNIAGQLQISIVH